MTKNEIVSVEPEGAMTELSTAIIETPDFAVKCSDVTPSAFRDFRMNRRRTLHFGVLLALFAASRLWSADTVKFSPDAPGRALEEIGRDKARLVARELSFHLDWTGARYLPFLDRRKLGSPPLEDFDLDHASFFGSLAAWTDSRATRHVTLVEVSGTFTEDIQAEQRTPQFLIKWKVSFGPGLPESLVEGFAFGPIYNNLTGSRETRRRRMLDATTIAYEGALAKAALKLNQLVATHP